MIFMVFHDFSVPAPGSSTGRVDVGQEKTDKAKPESPRKTQKESSRPPPGTVIQFKKKGSQKVEEEVVLGGEREKVNEKSNSPRPEKEYLAGYKVCSSLFFYFYFFMSPL
jgi:hypothetical protein